MANLRPLDKLPSPEEMELVVPQRLEVKRCSEDAVLPVRATAGAAGYDLFSAQEVCIPPGRRQVVRTDICLAVPTGHYGRIAPRSGLSFKKGIDIGAGVIDSDYRGPVGILIINNGPSEFQVEKGTRIAQLLLERVSRPEPVWVDELPTTDRGPKGFGSTGTGKIVTKIATLSPFPTG